VDVKAPMCVQSSVFRQKKEGAERLLVHLFNDVNTTAFHGLPENDVPLREETLPIHEIEVVLHGYQVSEAIQQPENAVLEMRRDGDNVRVTVPRLDIHSVVVFELEAPQ
jgi:hypothetical protein